MQSKENGCIDFKERENKLMTKTYVEKQDENDIEEMLDEEEDEDIWSDFAEEFEDMGLDPEEYSDF